MTIEQSERANKSGCQLISGFLETARKDLRSPCDPIHIPLNGLSTGIDELDRLTTGLKAGSLIVIAGRPSMGSTSFALNIAQKIALEQSKSVVIFSLDFDGPQAVRRMSSLASKKSVSLCYSPTVGASSEPSEAVLTRLRKAPIYIDDKATSLPEIRESLHALMENGISPDLVLIDNLQMLSDIGESEAAIRAIRKIAQEKGMAIVLTSRLLRRPERRRNKRPRLSDLPKGVITGGADLVMTLFCNGYYEPDAANKGITEICVMRNRFGKTGILELGLS